MRCPRSAAAPPSTCACSSPHERQRPLRKRESPRSAQREGSPWSADSFCRPARRVRHAWTPLAGVGATRRRARYARARLVDVHGAPIRLRALAAETNYVFHYPFAATPCLLLKLAGAVTVARRRCSREDGDDVRLAGRRGTASATSSRSPRSARTSSRIRRARCRSSATSASAPRRPARRSSIAAPTTASTIPRQGARVVAGPAPQPLAAILLEYDAARRRAVRARHGRAPSSSTRSSRSTRFKLALEYGGKARRRGAGRRPSCASSRATARRRSSAECGRRVVSGDAEGLSPSRANGSACTSSHSRRDTHRCALDLWRAAARSGAGGA